MQLLGQMGIKGVVSAGLAALPAVISEHGVKFWVAVVGLLAAGVARVPTSYTGSLLLHGYLTDLALALDRKDVLERMLNTCRRLCPRARIGFHTNLAAEAANILPLLDAKVDEISVLTSPQGRGLDRNMDLLRQAQEPPPSLTAEVGLAPALIQRLAASSPQAWARGADAILLAASADEELGEIVRAEKEQAWSEVLPGLAMPEAAL